MSVRKRGDHWHVDVSVGGRRLRAAVGRGLNRAQALQLEAKLKSDWHAGRIGRAPSHSLSEALERWLEGEARALAYYEDLEAKVRALLPFIKGRDLTEAGDAADKAKAKWLSEKRAPATINRRLAILRRVVRLAYWEWKWLEKPVKIGMVPGERARMTQLDPAQAKVFLAACRKRGPALLDAVLLDLHTGLRPKELLALGPQHYRPGKPVRKGRSGGARRQRSEPGRIVLDAHTKTGRPRSIPLTAEAEAIAKRLPIDIKPDEYRYNFRKAAEAAGMPWLQRRDLRRTFGSWIVQRTKNLKAAQDLLGHASIAITSKHYAHLLDEHLVDAVAELPRGLGRSQRRHKKQRTRKRAA